MSTCMRSWPQKKGWISSYLTPISALLLLSPLLIPFFGSTSFFGSFFVERGPLTVGGFSLWYNEDSAGREERSVPANLERPDGDMVEIISYSQTLIERSSTWQLRSFTSTIEQAAR